VLGGALADAQLARWRLGGDGRTAEALFSCDDVPDWPALRSRLRDRFGDRLAIDEGLAAVSVVGPGLGAARELDRATAAAGRLGVELLGLDASPLRLTLLVRPTAVDPLIRALHDELVAAP
jgi:aspartokinase